MKHGLLEPRQQTRDERLRGNAGLIELSCADARDRERIHRLRHDIYAHELGQHVVNGTGRLHDSLDDWNSYLVAREHDAIVGFVSITPPPAPSFSIDKYFAREDMPLVLDDSTYEVRLLTVVKPRRGSEIAAMLMYAAFRWVEAHGGTRIVGIGRKELMGLYQRCGLQATGLITRSGRVTYELMHATIAGLRERAGSFRGLIPRLKERMQWRFPFEFQAPAACFHGGAFFEAIGPGFESLERRHDIINADVLDAWFPPAPSVIRTLHDHLPWLLRTSPPTDCSGLVAAIASARHVSPRNILPGAGSSDLIFRALNHWLRPDSHVLILDPTYGEYAHVLERLIRCRVDRLALLPGDQFEVDTDRLAAALRNRYDLVVLVNPNSPTGRHLPRPELERLLRAAPADTRLWIDETYVEYAGAGESLERFAAASENVIVCKSMSKVYALSGARAAYLCAGAHQLENLRALTPPWVIGLPSQVAAVRALAEPEYYAARHSETAALREELSSGLQLLGWRVLPGIANFLLCELPPSSPDAETFVDRCRARGLFLRNAGSMGAGLGERMIRLAVKDQAANQRMLAILRSVCDP